MNGIEMIEIQTPFLSVEAAETLLGTPDDLQKDKSKVNHESAKSNSSSDDADQKLDPSLTE